MALYQQAATPDVPAAGDIWINTSSGVFSIRNVANSAWVAQNVSIDSTNGGLAKLASPAFTGTPTINGDTAATREWVDGTWSISPALTGTPTIGGVAIATETYVDTVVAANLASVGIFMQAATPATSAAGNIWLNTTSGLWYIRNTSDTTWIQMGNFNSTYGGLLNRGGGNMTGAITGAHGLAPTDAPAFTTSITLDGQDLATEAWTTLQITDAVAAIGGTTGGSSSSSTSSGGTTSFQLGNKFASVTGTLPITTTGDGWIATVPTLPAFSNPDGSTTAAAITDCAIKIAVPAYITFGQFVNGNTRIEITDVSDSSDIKFYATAYSDTGGRPQTGIILSYTIIATR